MTLIELESSVRRNLTKSSIAEKSDFNISHNIGWERLRVFSEVLF